MSSIVMRHHLCPSSIRASLMHVAAKFLTAYCPEALENANARPDNEHRPKKARIDCLHKVSAF